MRLLDLCMSDGTSQPEITCVSLILMKHDLARVGATYSCTVYVEGHTNILHLLSY